MSVFPGVPSLLDELSRLPRQQWLIRALIPAATATMVVLEELAGASVHLTFPLLAAGLSLLVAALPDSGAGLFLVLLLGGHWAIAVPEQLTVWVLAAAVALLALHTAAVLASYGPATLALDRDLLRLWGRRSALLLGVTAVAWLLAVAASGVGLPGGGWLLGTALVVVSAWAGYLSRRLT
jgi:hypothetical protein